MANPTTAPPTAPEWDSVGNANLKFYAPFTEPSGSLRDLVSGIQCQRYDGFGIASTGRWPQRFAATVGGLAVSPYKFIWGSGALRWIGAGWTSGTSLATARTMALVFRANALQGVNAYVEPGVQTVPIFHCAPDNANFGLAFQISATGVVTLGQLRNFGSFASMGYTLTPGNWYAAYLSITSATGRSANVYDYGAQALGTPYTTADSFSFSFNGATPDMVINHGFVTNSGPCDVLCAVADNESWDVGTNPTLFSAFYGDPWVWARATYTSPGGALTAGTSQFAYSTATSATVTCTRPTGGVNGTLGTAYTYQWYYQDLTPVFTPPATGTILVGQTGPTCTDATIKPGVVRYYKCVQSDGTSTVVTIAAPARTTNVTVDLGLIGDSRTANNPGPQGLGLSVYSAASNWRMGVINRGLGATTAGWNNVSSLSWAPGSFLVAGSGNSSGNVVISWRGSLSNPFAWNASAATVTTALAACATIGAGNVFVAGSNVNSGYNILLSGAALPSPVGSTAMTLDGSSTVNGTVSPYSLYGSAVAHFLADARTDILVALGTNDGGSLPSVFQTNLGAIAHDLVACGFRVHLASPPWTLTTDQTVQNLVQFAGAITALANGTTIFANDLSQFAQTCSDPGALLDLKHNIANGWYGEAYLWWRALQVALDAANSGGSGGGAGRGSTRISLG